MKNRITPEMIFDARFACWGASNSTEYEERCEKLAALENAFAHQCARRRALPRRISSALKRTSNIPKFAHV